MSHRIQDLKSALTFGGARASLFNVVMQIPRSIDFAGKAQLANKISVLCESASLPASTMGKVVVPYFGRDVNFAGNRTFSDWTVTIINDEDFALRDAFEKWSKAMNDHSLNIRSLGATSNAETYKTDAIVRQYAKDKTTAIRKYKFEGLFPLEVSSIELNWGTKDEIERFTVTFAYDLWEVDETRE